MASPSPYVKVVRYPPNNVGVEAPTEVASALFAATIDNNIAVVTELCKEWAGHAEVLDWSDSSFQGGRTVLNYASFQGFEECARELIAAGANLEAQDSGDRGANALIVAAYWGKTSICQMLTKEGAIVNSPRRSDDKTALEFAKENNHPDIVAILESALLEEFKQEQREDSITMTPYVKIVHYPPNNVGVEAPADVKSKLFAATERNNIAVVTELCKEWAGHAAVLDWCNPKAAGRTALNMAALKANEECARELIAAGANLETLDSGDRGATPLIVAAYWGKRSMCRLLTKEGARVNTPRRSDGKTALTLAKEQHKHACRAILEAALVDEFKQQQQQQPASVKVVRYPPNNVGIEAPADVKGKLFAAVIGNKITVVTELCQEWAGHAEVLDWRNTVTKDIGGRTPLNYAAWKGLEQCARQLIAAGADLEAQDGGDRGANALIVAAYWHQTSMCRLLTDEGARVNAPRRSDGRTALEFAKELEHFDVIAVLETALDNELKVASMHHASSVEEFLAHPVAAAFFEAIREDRGDDVRRLLNVHADIMSSFIDMPDATSPHKDTPVSTCCRLGNDKILSILINEGQANVNTAVGAEKETPLFVASVAGQAACIKLLLENGAEVDKPAKSGKTPLFICCISEDPRILPCVALLLAAHADPNLVEPGEYAMKNTYSPLYMAAQQGNPQVVALLMAHNGDPTKIMSAPFVDSYNEKYKQHSLQVAVKNGSTKCASLMIAKEGIDLDIPNSVGTTPFFSSCQWGHEEVASLLLAKGAKPDVPNDNGNTPLWTACEYNHVYNAKLLLALGDEVVNKNVTNKKGQTPLYIASYRGNENIVALLLSCRCDTSICCVNDVNYGNTSEGASPLFIAAQEGHTNVCSMLLFSNADVNLVNKHGESPLATAAKHAHKHVVEKLLQFFPSDIAKGKEKAAIPFIKKLFDEHETAIGGPKVALKMFCVTNNLAEVIKLLQTKVLSVRDMDSCDKAHPLTALMICAALGRFECLEALLAAGVNVEAKAEKDRNRTAIIYAAEAGNLPIVIRLIECKANYTRGTWIHNETPLWAAARRSQVEVMKYLLTLPDCDSTKTDSHGETALAMYIKNTTLLDQELVLDLLDRDLPCDDAGVTKLSHGHSWSFLLESSTLKDETCKSFVEQVLNKHRHLIKHLATALDKYERSVTHVTHKIVKRWIDERLFFCGKYEIKNGPALHRSATALVVEGFDHSVEDKYHRSFDKQAAGKHSLEFATFAEAVKPFGLQNEEKLQEAFKFADTFDSGHIEREEFVSFCTTYFGKTSPVALKFMKSEKQWAKEINARIYCNLKPEFVVELIEHRSPKDSSGVVFREALEGEILYDGTKLTDYPYMIVMPMAERTLEDIFVRERPTIDQTRLIVKELAQALAHMHEGSSIHCDLKMLNVLRHDGSIKLIDMDACTDVYSEDAESFAGTKFSTGNLPPEMFFELDKGGKTKVQERQYLDYWAEEREADSDLWRSKLKPVSVRKGSSGKARKFVVRSLRTKPVVDQGEEGRVEDGGVFVGGVEPILDGLPYAPIRAEPTLDIWALGVILYSLCTGKPFVPVNRDDDLDNDEAFFKAATVTDAEISELIRKNVTNCPAAVDLLNKLLCVNPKIRLQSMADVLKHAFMTGEGADSESMQLIAKQLEEINARTKMIDERTQLILENTIEIKNMSTATLDQIRKTEQVLLRGMFEAADVTVPSLFIIRNSLILEEEENEGDPDADDDAELVPSHSLIVENAVSQATSAILAACPDGVLAERVKAASRFMAFMGRVGEQVSAGVSYIAHKAGDAGSAVGSFINDPAACIGDAIHDMVMSGDKFYLYLVDERTKKPITKDPKGIYPILIEKPAEFIGKAMPLMKIGLKAMALFNGVSGVARCMGYPTPMLSKEVRDSAKNFVGGLDKESSVAEFDCLQGTLNKVGEDGGDEQKKSVRGAALREFARFLEEKDKDHTFCNLRRVAAPDGSCCWTSDEEVEKMQNESAGAAESASSPPSAAARAAGGGGGGAPSSGSKSSVDKKSSFSSSSSASAATAGGAAGARNNIEISDNPIASAASAGGAFTADRDLALVGKLDSIYKRLDAKLEAQDKKIDALGLAKKPDGCCSVC